MGIMGDRIIKTKYISILYNDTKRRERNNTWASELEDFGGSVGWLLVALGVLFLLWLGSG